MFYNKNVVSLFTFTIKLKKINYKKALISKNIKKLSINKNKNNQNHFEMPFFIYRTRV